MAGNAIAMRRGDNCDVNRANALRGVASTAAKLINARTTSRRLTLAVRNSVITVMEPCK